MVLWPYSTLYSQLSKDQNKIFLVGKGW